jgi:hypothetical protein
VTLVSLNRPGVASEASHVMAWRASVWGAASIPVDDLGRHPHHSGTAQDLSI